MKHVTVVEMQTRLPESLATRDADLTQVTYQGKPVVAVLDLEHYQTFQTVLQSDYPTIQVEVTREGVSAGQRLFHSYAKRLAPRLQGSERVIKVIEVTRQKHLIGALLAWNDWLRITDRIQIEEHAYDDQTLTIVGARNHLLRLPEQFQRQEHQGIFAPVLVSKQGDPVMAIVSWGWFERVTRFLRTHLVPFTRMEGDGTLVLSSNEAIEQAPRAPEHLRPLWTHWSLFHQRASELAVTVAQVTHPDPSPEQSYARLEEQCAAAVRQGQELLSLVTRLRHEQEEECE